MSDELKPGLHEALIDEALRARLDRARSGGWQIDTRPLDDAALPNVLARYVHDHVRDVIANVPSSRADRRRLQLEIANRVLDVLAGVAARSDAGPIDLDGLLLLEVKRPIDRSLVAAATPRPGIPLRDSTLLVNGHRDLQIGTQVALEIQSADRIDLLCAFVRWAGLRMIRRELQEFLLRGGEMRVIASVYTGSTEKRALDELVGLGAQVKVSYETNQTRLHAKAWLFQRNTGFSTAYVGSSNLTQSALLDGLEWNVRATQVDNPAILERIAATFEQYWHEPEFESYDPRVDGERLQAALEGQAGARTSPAPIHINLDLQPKPFQAQILEALDAERQRGHFRNLVVAPTGTGKTWVAAFDYRRLRQMGIEGLLFVAHRDEILLQSQAVFRLVLNDPQFGERHVGAERPVLSRHVFASIQSLHRNLDKFDPSAWDMVIVDEFHHAEAPTYQRLLDHLKPRILVGLTATPERADGQNVARWFDERVASDLRLWDALDQGLLCPFHYLGIGDGTDLRAIGFVRGRYVAADLEDIYTGDHLRARRILDAVREWVLEPTTMRALGFCVGIHHARFMAQQFNEAGLPAVALMGDSASSERADAIRRLRRGELNAIFTVDIFNEGVDIPEVDTILMLRPTESATVFLQQLGRGLRWADGKTVLTVLDFVGQAHVDYRFDVRYRALVGGTRRQLERAISDHFPLMPPGCVIRLDEIAQEIVLGNIRSSLQSTRKALVDDLRSLDRDTKLGEFLSQSEFDLQDVYSRPSGGTTFTSARRMAGHLPKSPAPIEPVLSKSIGKMLHIDDEERYVSWREILTSTTPPAHGDASSRSGRLSLMLFAALGYRQRPVADLGAALAELWSAPQLRDEMIDLLDVLRDRVRHETVPIDPFGLVPVHSHATYGLYELVAGYGLTSKGLLRENREGVVWSANANTDLLFITINKSDEDYSPTTRYDDYPVSPTLFHWESQSRTATSSTTGQRYVNHVARGSRVVLFVREHKRDDRDVSSPYLCLGPARYVRHESERPMRIVWELERPMPAEIFQVSKVAAG